MRYSLCERSCRGPRRPTRSLQSLLEAGGSILNTLITDPQVDFLTPDSVVWDKIGETIEKNAVGEKLVTPREAASEGDVPVIYSPDEYVDDEFVGWEGLNTIDQIMFDTRMFDADGAGSDFVPALAPDGTAFVLSPHKQLSGFWSNGSEHSCASLVSTRSCSLG